MNNLTLKTTFTAAEYRERLAWNMSLVEAGIKRELRLLYNLALTDLELKTLYPIAISYGYTELAAQIAADLKELEEASLWAH